MKRENLYLVGAALMASTSLTTAASAGTFYLVTQSPANGLVLSPAAKNLSAQAFAAAPATSQQIGRVSIAYKFNAPVQSDNTNITVGVTGAQFAVATIPSDLTAVNFSTSGTILTVSSGTTICSVQGGTTKLIITGCAFTGLSPGGTFGVAGSAGGVLITNIAFDNATGLATVGGAIALTADVTIGSTTLETTAAQNVVVSRNSILTTIAAASPINSINVSAVPAFSSITTNGLSVTIGTVTTTLNSALAADLTTAITAANGVGAANELKVTSAALTNAGFAGMNVGGLTATSGLTQATSGSVTFTVSQASLINTFSLNVQFSGTVAIPEAAAGTATMTYAALGQITTNQSAPPSATGATAALARAGLNIDLNGVQPSVGQGARTYTSLLRIANTGTTEGTISVRLSNEATGAILGTYTSPSIPSGGSLQVSSAQLEVGAGVTPQASILYRARVTGAITGYVQHVNWNQDSGFFSDLSARRTGVVTQ